MAKTLGIMGRKLGMTRVFGDDGSAVPVTVIAAGPCPVIQVKDASTKDKYAALQIGFEEVDEKKLNKPARGHQAKAGSFSFRFLKEIRLDNVGDFEPGSEVKVDIFSPGERVKVSGTSKGKGFQGVMKRWNFRGSPASHGHEKVHRSPGGIGQCASPGKVFKGKKMPGQMGNRKVTCLNVEVVDVRVDENLLLLKGQVPGSKNGLVMVRKQ